MNAEIKKPMTFHQFVMELLFESKLMQEYAFLEITPMKFQDKEATKLLIKGYSQNFLIMIIEGQESDLYEIYLLDDNENILRHIRDIFWCLLSDNIDLILN